MQQTIEVVPVQSLKPYPGNARSHGAAQVRKLARSIQRFGWMNPILVNAQFEVIAGHGRLEAAKFLKIDTVPIVRFEHLKPEEERAYRLADNRLAEDSAWDTDLLRVELDFLMTSEISFDIDLLGFDVAEIDVALGKDTDDVETPLPPLPANKTAVSRPGDLWTLDRHRVLCGDSRDKAGLALLMHGERARMILTDPPFNVKVANISGLGQHQHAEFAMASGEMTHEEFVAFLEATLGAGVDHCFDGSLVYAFMDWAHLHELRIATHKLGLKPINLCVWAKTNAGMGSLYRSQHEMVWITKVGKAPHRNHVELGKNGRYRSNVWTYAGQNTFGSERDAALASHPTCKPVPLLADAIRDVTNQTEIVLDLFLGSGSTLIAAQKTHRRCFGVEYEPKYVDVILQRWMALTGLEPVLEKTGQTYAEVEVQRLAART